ncbi:hypothetical protein M427DRAFT_51115 [Gonapodya prolifera JEL478]|uniref:Biogenesis of lysosome-related organelles complex 1 subunit 2 n=1 Tax=Gonapodya prolifera (strain JEL478) TaxID=1344416 RepID=A0A139AZ35_GONPJ|nr:hypothetical protein M427DRAFT_51115 [Gonapodya prolifera JEL478]|eukprot:KXS21735.1 hypothetical protein M427DRAFT_51115 [Gonapodya prolifera JEL478]
MADPPNPAGHSSVPDSDAPLHVFDATLATLTQYIHAELATATQDYRTLEAMNNAVREKCAGFSEKTQGLIEKTAMLQQGYNRLSPLLERVSALDTEVTFLESVAKDLEEYTRHIGECAS